MLRDTLRQSKVLLEARIKTLSEHTQLFLNDDLKFIFVVVKIEESWKVNESAPTSVTRLGEISPFRLVFT